MRLFFLVSILLFAIETQAQSLTLLDLQNLCKKQSWEAVDNYLSRKGWKYHDSKQGSSSQYSTITYSYNKNSWDDRAEGWFSVYAYNNEVHKISYSCGLTNTYNSIKGSLASNGYKKTNSEILNQRIQTTHENSLYKIEISTEQAENDDYDTHYDWYYFYVIRKNGVYDSENGPVTNYWFDGVTIREEYTLKDGKYNGTYKSYTEDGDLQLSLNYVNDKKQGKGVVYFEDGGRKEMNFLNDELSGIVKTFDSDGTLRKLETYINGKQNGKYEEYAENGKLIFETVLKDAVMSGITKRYEEDGTPISVETYQNGKKNGKLIAYEDGVRILETTMKEDSINGKYTVYFDDGVSVKRSGTKIMGIEEGPFVSYFDKNNKYEEGNYHEGLKVGKWIQYPLPESEDGVESMRIEQNYKDGKLEGMVSFINKAGLLALSQEYSNGFLNGEKVFYEYDSEGTLVGKEIQNYYDNEKHGKYSSVVIGRDTTFEIEYANYLYGKKNGMAKTNYQDYVIVANYRNDKLNGVYEKYMEKPFSFDLYDIPIGFKNIKDLWLKSKYTYSDDDLDGAFTEYTNNFHNTRLWQTGYFSRGLKSSVWKTYRQQWRLEESDKEVDIPGFDFKGKPLTEKSEPEELLYSQTFSNGVLNGQTVSYLRFVDFDEKDSSEKYEKCEIKVDFSNGKFNGNYSSRNQDGELEATGYFSNGQPSKFSFYNNSKHPMEYEFYSDKITLKVVNDNREQILATYSYNKTKWLDYDSNTISNDFDFGRKSAYDIPVLYDMTQTQFLKSFESEKKNGLYEIRDKSGDIILTGFLCGNDKYGLWQYYHRDQNVRVTENESISSEPTRFYFIDTNQPFSGEFMDNIEYQGSRYNAVFKVKNGLLDGKTKYNDPATGKTVVSFKYKEGVLEK